MKTFKSKITTLVFTMLVLACVGITSGCMTETVSSDSKQAEATRASLKHANNMVGMPHIINYTQKKLLKQIYELCDREKLIVYIYTKSDYTGLFVYQGKGIGYGVPFSAQFTNPEKIVEGDKYFGYDIAGYLNYLTVLPQADPNGIFMPTSSTATWCMVIDYYGIPRVVYIEPEIVVSPFPLPYAVYPEGFKPGIPVNFPGCDIDVTGKATPLPIIE